MRVIRSLASNLVMPQQYEIYIIIYDYIIIYIYIYRITLHHANKTLLWILSYILKMDHSIIPDRKHLWLVCEKDTCWEIARMATGCIYHKLSCKMMYSSESTRDSSDVS